ncbi:Lrp/AsnC family transcriptional regulator [Archaeoglobus neptunius]|uniref:Lrp/AsnC family transcriptional regulator n=1 Tax=Archaeoglobus neptunius TaxID=2798580 RepID=UPI0019264DE9|nr:Lrp/AsnC family transcriptional regulator [Archaeoglobus neptunius]
MDERDRKIISILQRSGRPTLSEIGEAIGMSAMGAKKRIHRLESKNMVRLTTLLNTEKLGVLTAILAMEVESSAALERLLKKFENCPRIIKFFVTTGGYNLFALIWAEDLHSLESVTLEKCSLRAQPGIRRYEVYPVQGIHYDPFLEIRVVADKVSSAPCGVDCGSCSRYRTGKCLACPATVYYRGKL